jgi:hypothetical protein
MIAEWKGSENMSQSWHDINDPGFFKPKAKESPSARTLDNDASAMDIMPKQEPEIKLVSATWKEGAEGYEFNKKCSINIKAEFLKETSRRKITCRLFLVYDGQEEDLNHQVGADLEDDGTANAEMTLYYGNAYYYALQENPEATCEYKVKVTHPTASAELESEPLDMPNKKQSNRVFKVRLQIDPEQAAADEDAFILISTDAESSYNRTLTVANDKIKGDKFIDLEFDNLIKDLDYSLKILPGNKEKGYFLFQNKPYSEIV